MSDVRRVAKRRGDVDLEAEAFGGREQARRGAFLFGRVRILQGRDLRDTELFRPAQLDQARRRTDGWRWPQGKVAPGTW